MKNGKFVQRNVIMPVNVMVFAFLLFVLGQAQQGVAQVTYSDSTALVAFYNSTNGSSWSSATNWLTGPVGTWEGVTISNRRVTDIYLPFNNLSGVLTSKLQQLTRLKSFGVPGNQIGGKVISAFGNLEKLESLDLSENNFTGSIPSGITYLPRLTSLNLSGNELTGRIPSTIGLLCKLTYLNLGQNLLSGSIPVSVGNLYSLKDLFLEGNQLTGSIPSSIGNLERVKQVYLLNNKLSGALPSSIGNMDSLVYFNVANNQLTGSVPASVANLTQIYLFNIESNKIENLPNLSGVASLFQFIVGNNKLTFADIEPNITKMLPGSYAPQDSVGTNQTISVCAGDSLVLSAGVIEPSPNNSFTWFTSDFSFVSDPSSSPLLILPNVTVENSGVYLAEISNSNVPDLFLYRKAIFVTVNTCSDVAVARSGDTNVYPAPFQFETTVEVTTPVQEDLVVTVLDAQGHVVSAHSGLKTNEKISVGAQLNPGLYYIKSQHGGKREVVRVVKK